MDLGSSKHFTCGLAEHTVTKVFGAFNDGWVVME
jgi:hypothetical protein